MPMPLLITVSAVSLGLMPILFFLQRALSRDGSFRRGLIVPSILALLVYLSFGVILTEEGLWVALLMLLIMNLPLFFSLSVYIVFRLRRYHKRLALYRKQQKEKKPPLVASVALRNALKGFVYASHLPHETVSEIVILLKSGTTHEKIAATYDLSVSELRRIEKAFDRYLAERDDLKGGEDYVVSPEQGEFFLQLMVNATPKSLDCGDRLLWNPASVARLFAKATKVKPSEKSVATFLADMGALPMEKELAVTRTPEALAWRESEYRKIRLSALERDATIYWVMSSASPTAKRRHTLTAIASDGSTSFGVYKGSGGFVDFLNKLPAEASSHVYAVVCNDYKDSKNLSALSPDVTLFALGEVAVIPDHS